LITDGKAKYEDTVESVYAVPRELLSEQHRAVYADGVDWAGRCSMALRNAVGDYAKEQKAETDPVTAERHFWQSLEDGVDTLFAATRAYGSDVFSIRDDEWRSYCRDSAMAAYRRACPSTTPRQIQAFAKGMKRLRFGVTKNKTKGAK
jgi:hypothetical protein